MGVPTWLCHSLAVRLCERHLISLALISRELWIHEAGVCVGGACLAHSRAGSGRFPLFLDCAVADQRAGSDSQGPCPWVLCPPATTTHRHAARGGSDATVRTSAAPGLSAPCPEPRWLALASRHSAPASCLSVWGPLCSTTPRPPPRTPQGSSGAPASPITRRPHPGVPEAVLQHDVKTVSGVLVGDSSSL